MNFLKNMFTYFCKRNKIYMKVFFFCTTRNKKEWKTDYVSLIFVFDLHLSRYQI